MFRLNPRPLSEQEIAGLINSLSGPYQTILTFVYQISTGESILSAAIDLLQRQQNNQDNINEAKKIAEDLRSFLLDRIVRVDFAPHNEEERKRLYRALLLLARLFPLNQGCNINGSFICSTKKTPLTLNSPLIFTTADGTWFLFDELLECLNGNTNNPYTNRPFFREDLIRIQLIQKERYNTYLYSFFQAGISAGFVAFLSFAISPVVATAATITTALVITECVLPFILWLGLTLFMSKAFRNITRDGMPDDSLFDAKTFNLLNVVMGIVALSCVLTVTPIPFIHILSIMGGAGLTGGAAGAFLSLFLKPFLNYLTDPKDGVINKNDESSLNSLMPVTVKFNTPSLGERLSAGWERFNLFSSCTPSPIQPVNDMSSSRFSYR